MSAEDDGMLFDVKACLPMDALANISLPAGDCCVATRTATPTPVCAGCTESFEPAHVAVRRRIWRCLPAWVKLPNLTG